MNKNFKVLLMILVLAMLGTIFVYSSVHAFNPLLGKSGDNLSSFPGEDLEANDVIKIVTGLSCWLTRIASVLALIFVILAGLRFVTAQGNPTKHGEAVKNFQTVLWGILVIYGVYVIIATVAHAVGAGFSFVPLVC